MAVLETGDVRHPSQTMIRPALLCLLLTGCASGPLGEMSGQYRAEIGPDCGLTLDSVTIKGGPNLVLERSPDGACRVSVEHDQRAELLPALLELIEP